MDTVPGRGAGATVEVARAFLVFGAFLAVLVGLAAALASRDLGKLVEADRVERGREEARRIAEGILELGLELGDGEGLDFYRLRFERARVEAWLRDRIARSGLVHGAELLDRFGGRVVQVEGGPWGGDERYAASASTSPSALHTVSVALRSGRGGLPEGELRVSVASSPADAELEAARRSFRRKIVWAAVLGMLVLAAAFAYVLYLIRKNRALESERQAANRRAQVALLGSGLAHEIRNPLNAMNLNLQMLEEELQGVPGLEAAEVGELLSSIKEEIRRLERLVENFLLYARPTAPRFEEADLNRLLSELARFFQADFRQSGIRLALDLEPLLPSVEMDTTQVKQALMNLLVNARQVLRPGGTVTVRSRPGPSGEVVVEVQDDGPGIPAEVRAKIFDVFYSGRGGGTGLGLAIAQQIVTHHGGAIEVDSEEGRGTTFRIRLPRRQARRTAAATAAHTAP